jgi:hypothetical protein
VTSRADYLARCRLIRAAMREAARGEEDEAEPRARLADGALLALSAASARLQLRDLQWQLVRLRQARWREPKSDG